MARIVPVGRPQVDPSDSGPISSGRRASPPSISSASARRPVHPLGDSAGQPAQPPSPFLGGDLPWLVMELMSTRTPAWRGIWRRLARRRSPSSILLCSPMRSRRRRLSRTRRRTSRRTNKPARRGRWRFSGIMSEDSPAEAEADAMADQVARHGPGVHLPPVTQAHGVDRTIGEAAKRAPATASAVHHR